MRAVLHFQRHVVDKSGDPGERYHRVHYPLAQQLLTGCQINDLQITLDVDGGKVDHGPIQRTPQQAVSDEHSRPTDKGSERPDHRDFSQLHRIRYNKEDGAAQIEHILIEYQQQLFVLPGNHQSVEYESVGHRSNNTDDDDAAQEVEIDDIRR